MHRRWLLALAVLGTTWVGSAPATAAPGVGDMAPAFEGKEFVNTPRVTMADLRGQVLLYEIFRTW